MTPESRYWVRFPVGPLTSFRSIGSAVWLYCWLITHVTDPEDGQVFGTAPQRDADVAHRLGVSPRTVAAWRRTLLARNWIAVKRSPFGYRYMVRRGGWTV